MKNSVTFMTAMAFLMLPGLMMSCGQSDRHKSRSADHELPAPAEPRAVEHNSQVESSEQQELDDELSDQIGASELSRRGRRRHHDDYGRRRCRIDERSRRVRISCPHYYGDFSLTLPNRFLSRYSGSLSCSLSRVRRDYSERRRYARHEIVCDHYSSRGRHLDRFRVPVSAP